MPRVVSDHDTWSPWWLMDSVNINPSPPCQSPACELDDAYIDIIMSQWLAAWNTGA